MIPFTKKMAIQWKKILDVLIESELELVDADEVVDLALLDYEEFLALPTGKEVVPV
jgi:hypothetical protein